LGRYIIAEKMLDKMQFDNSLLLFSNDNFGFNQTTDILKPLDLMFDDSAFDNHHNKSGDWWTKSFIGNYVQIKKCRKIAFLPLDS
jgi:hypothetical protein